MTDQRDPERFPWSTRYRQHEQATCKVPAAALLLAHCHLVILELLAQGQVSRLAAAEAGYFLFVDVLGPACEGGVRNWPLPPGIVIRDDGGVDLAPIGSCLGASCERAMVALRLPWEEVARVDRGAPAAWLHPEDLDLVLWLEETCRRFANGGELYQSARGAHDQHLGKPRQRRQPVEPAWFAEQLEVAQTVVWWSLLHARQGGGRLWLRDLADETRRPTWDPEQTAKHVLAQTLRDPRWKGRVQACPGPRDGRTCPWLHAAWVSEVRCDGCQKLSIDPAYRLCPGPGDGRPCPDKRLTYGRACCRSCQQRAERG